MAYIIISNQRIIYNLVNVMLDLDYLEIMKLLHRHDSISEALGVLLPCSQIYRHSTT